MKHRYTKEGFPGYFIITILVFLIVIISVIFAAVSQTNGKVQKSTEQHVLNDMSEDVYDYAKIIGFSLENGIDSLDTILDSDVFEYKLIFVTDPDGNFCGKSKLANYTISDDNLFDAFSDARYSGRLDENDIRRCLKNGDSGFFSVKLSQKEYLSFCPIDFEDYRLIYMLHDSDMAKLYGESADYLDSVHFLAAAYITATVALAILMCSYIISIVRTNSLKLKLSKLMTKHAKEETKIYSDITRVLSRSYDRIYYVNSANDHYMEFRAPLFDSETPLQCEGDNFWEIEKNEILNHTVESDREAVISFFDKKRLSDSISANGGNERIRFKMTVDGSEMYYFLRACILRDEEKTYYIIGLKNVDEMVMHDMQQLVEKEAALRRLQIYRGAMLNSMLAYFEIDITDNKVIDGPFVAELNKEIHKIEKSIFHMPDTLDNLVEIWGDYLYEPGKAHDDYVQGNKSESLKNQYENGNSIVNFEFEAKWSDGSTKFIKQSYYMMRREEDGNIQAICVLYDETEKKEHEREIKNLSEALTRSRIRISTGQMQPHFLYNILGSIREIILDDPQYASDLICDFTTHLRACVKSLSNDDLIPFSKEIENIHAYVNIERMRFGDRMQVEFDIQNEDFEVMPLSIQPLVENSIRHGLFPKKDGMGTVKISSFRKNGFNVVVVSDDGVGFDYEQIQKEVREHKRDSTGLLNLTLRLETVLKAKVYFDSVIGVGTTVTVLIPEKKEDSQNESDYS